MFLQVKEETNWGTLGYATFWFSYLNVKGCMYYFTFSGLFEQIFITS